MSIDLSSAPTTSFTPSAEHARLSPLTGEWTGQTRTWLEPGQPPEETVTEARVESILGGRFLRVQYTGTVMGKPHAGEMLFAFEVDAKEHSLAWVDSFHTGTALMLSKGAPSADGAVSVLGSYAAGAERGGWRTVLRPDSARLVIEAFNIAPAGEEYPAIRTELLRRA